ncbi:MAG: M20/M25/M40 family metallo-hydrolase, partial [Oscillospiraceae bacterium]|nr:M20/M25/M40 family metallo-hydrolase [Oscillospiraceae bacterium]
MTEDIAARVADIAEENRDRFIGYLMHLHRHPEISLREYETTKYIKDIMSELGIPLHGSQPETGAVFLLQGAEPGPCVALRADIDALEITEQSSCPFPSQNEGAMHACGHDVHTSSLLGAAVILSKLRDHLKGSVKFIFQPA